MQIQGLKYLSRQYDTLDFPTFKGNFYFITLKKTSYIIVRTKDKTDWVLS